MNERLEWVPAVSEREEFSPGWELGPELWPQIVTLPPGIGRLTSVRKLHQPEGHDDWGSRTSRAYKLEE